MEEYMCLEPNCAHTFIARKEARELAKPRQCPKCWSYHVIPVNEYIKAKQKAVELIRTTPFGIIPLWDIVQATFLERGIRLTPIVTLKLCRMLYKDITQDLGLPDLTKRGEL